MIRGTFSRSFSLFHVRSSGGSQRHQMDPENTRDNIANALAKRLQSLWFNLKVCRKLRHGNAEKNVQNTYRNQFIYLQRPTISPLQWWELGRSMYQSEHYHSDIPSSPCTTSEKSKFPYLEVTTFSCHNPIYMYEVYKIQSTYLLNVHLPLNLSINIPGT